MQPFASPRDGIPRLAAPAPPACWYGEFLEGRQRGSSAGWVLTVSLVTPPERAPWLQFLKRVGAGDPERGE